MPAARLLKSISGLRPNLAGHRVRFLRYSSKKMKESRALNFHLAILVVTPVDKQMVWNHPGFLEMGKDSPDKYMQCLERSVHTVKEKYTIHLACLEDGHLGHLWYSSIPSCPEEELVQVARLGVYKEGEKLAWVSHNASPGWHEAGGIYSYEY